MIKRILNDGISIINDEIVVDFDHDAETDILNILQPEIYKSEFLGNIYYFGYKFKDNASRHDRTIVLKWLKNLDNNGVDNKSLRRFIDKPILYLNKCINVTNLNAVIYPRSNRSNLTKSIIIDTPAPVPHTNKSFGVKKPKINQKFYNVYNNYYDGNSKYGIGNTQGGSVFSEANYFRNCKYPMLISKQGSDIAGDNEGTFSGEDGGIIKSFNNYIEGAKSYVTYQENNKEFDAYEVSSKDEIVPNSVKTKQGSHTYDNFDTNESIMYEYNVQTPIEAKEEVIAKAGRLDGGDFKWTFTEADDTSYDVDIKLKEAIFNYKSSIVKIGNDEINDEENDENGGNEEINPPVIEGAIAHSFTDDGLESDFFNISGNLSSSKGTVNYNGLTLTRCLKIESTTSITFNIDKPMKLILVFNEGINKNIYVDEVKQAISNGVLELTLQEGQHSIRKADSINLYYIQLLEVE